MKERGDMSIRLKIADFLIRTTMKPVLKRLNSPRLIRWWFENIVGDPLLAPRGLWQKPFVFEHAAGKLNGLCVGTKSHQSDAPAILYFFGGGFILFSIITSFIYLGVRNNINIYDTFIEGAKEGFGVAIKIIPYLIAMLCAIGAFTTSGAMDFIIKGLGSFFGLFLENTQEETK